MRIQRTPSSIGTTILIKKLLKESLNSSTQSAFQSEKPHPATAPSRRCKIIQRFLNAHAATLAGAAFALTPITAVAQIAGDGADDSACRFEASLSEGAESSYTYADQQGGLVLALDENGYTGIRFFGVDADMSNRTMMLWTFDSPLPIGGTGPAGVTIEASLGSAIGGQSFSSRDTSNGELLAPLEVTIEERELLSSGDENAVRLVGTVTGEVSVRNRPNPPVTASLNITFHGNFTFRPPGPYTLNCDSISY